MAPIAAHHFELVVLYNKDGFINGHCYMPSGELLPQQPGPILIPPDGERAKRGGEEGPSTQRYVVLRSTSVRPEDGGEYRCVVNNTAGQQTEMNITVNVLGEQVR